MPPKKKPAGIKSLIGKPINLANIYDETKVTGILQSIDPSFIGVEVEGILYYFSIHTLSGLTEEVKVVSSEPS